MSKLNLVANGFVRRKDLDFSDDGSRFVAYDYKGLPITYCRYNGNYYLSVRVDYQEHLFTWEDWRKTPEYHLADEFNGASEVDVNKLVDNCEKIIKRMAQLDEEVRNDVVDPYPVVGQLDNEIMMAKEVVEKFKNNFKWYDASEWELKNLIYYMKRCEEEIKCSEQFKEELLQGTCDIQKLRYHSQHLQDCGYVEMSEDDYYIKKMKEALN